MLPMLGYICFFLVLLPLCASQNLVCMNGCTITLIGGGGRAMIVTDDEHNCDVICCQGQMSYVNSQSQVTPSNYNLASFNAAFLRCGKQIPSGFSLPNRTDSFQPIRTADQTYCPNQWRNNATLSFPVGCTTSTGTTTESTTTSTETTTESTTTALDTTTESTTTTPDTTTESTSTTPDTTTESTSTTPDTTTESTTTTPATTTITTTPTTTIMIATSTTSIITTTPRTTTMTTTPATTTLTTTPATLTTTDPATTKTSTSPTSVSSTTTALFPGTTTSITPVTTTKTDTTAAATSPSTSATPITTTHPITSTSTSTTAASTITTTVPITTSIKATSTTTAITQTKTTTAFPVGRCQPNTDAKGVTHNNKCVEVDLGATCNNDENEPMCTCSSGYTDTYCGVAQAQLHAIGALAGAGGNATQVLNVISDAKTAGSAKFISNLPSLLSFLTDQQRMEMSYDVGDMIVDATYEGKALDLNKAFTASNDPFLGNCFTFNHWNSSFKYLARNIAKYGGLRVIVDVMPEEYVPWVDTQGINVYVHSIGQDIYVESHKIMSRPGGEDTLMLSRATSQLLSDHKETCASDKLAAQSFYFSGDYSVDGCYRSCYQDSCNTSCQCMDPSYTRKAGVPACTLDQLACVSEMATRRGDPYHWKECHCPQQCNSETFSIDYSRITLASKITCAQSGIYNSTATCVSRQSFVTVAFLTLEILVQTEVESFPMSKAIGNIGNVGGFLLGFSMVCFFEILAYLVYVGMMLMDQEHRAPEKPPAKPRKKELKIIERQGEKYSSDL